MNALTAIKPIWNRRTKYYTIEVLANADPLAAHHGYLVFDDARRCLEAIDSGRLLQGWKPAKVSAVRGWLLLNGAH